MIILLWGGSRKYTPIRKDFNMNNLHIKDGRYNLHGRLIFNTDKGELTLTPQDAIEIAYTLFDWANMDYAPIQDIEEKIEKGEL